MRLAIFVITAASLWVAVHAEASPLGELWEAKDFTALRASSYDRDGGNADGGQGNNIDPGEAHVLAELEGPGIVKHIWITISSRDQMHLRNLWLQVYWDGEEEPSIDTPVGDFFAQGHGMYIPFASQPVAIGNTRGLNCYWPMPFNRSARFVVENRGTGPAEAFYYYIDWEKHPRRFRDLRTLHAQYREETPVERDENYTFLYAEGEGHYVGVFHTVQQNSDGWWGEGDDMIWVDGERYPSLHGTGSEDYFNNAWGMGSNQGTPYFGALLNEKYKKDARHFHYRWHIEDPIPFEESIHVTIEHGHANDRSDDFSSVAFWYQAEPHRSFALEVPEARIHNAYTELSEIWQQDREQEGFDLLEAGRDLAQRWPEDRRVQDWWEGYGWEQQRKGDSPRDHLYVARVDRAISVDGSLQEQAWTQADWQSGFLANGNEPAVLPVRVACVYDEQNLYVCMVSEEDPRMENRLTVEPEDIREREMENVYQDDSVEFFLVPDLDSYEYYQLIINPNLAVYDGRGRVGAMDNEGLHWDIDLNVAQTYNSQNWVLEFAVSFEALGTAPPDEGDLWRFGVRRVRRWTGGGRERASFERWPTTDWLRGWHLSPLMGHLIYR